MIINKNANEIYKLYCSICFAQFQKNILTNLNPSSGGIGIILNTARDIFTDANKNQKFTKRSDCPKSTLKLYHTAKEYNISIKTAVSANTRLVAGPARATRSSSLRGFL
jgi:hypothetical protein